MEVVLATAVAHKEEDPATAVQTEADQAIMAATEVTSEVGLAMSWVVVEGLRSFKALVVMMHHWFQEAHITTDPLRISACQALAVPTSVQAKVQAQTITSNKDHLPLLTSEADPFLDQLPFTNKSSKKVLQSLLRTSSSTNHLMMKITLKSKIRSRRSDHRRTIRSSSLRHQLMAHMEAAADTPTSHW